MQKEKQVALLQQDIEKIKKTKIVEETVVIQIIPQYIPYQPYNPSPVYYCNTKLNSTQLC